MRWIIGLIIVGAFIGVVTYYEIAEQGYKGEIKTLTNRADRLTKENAKLTEDYATVSGQKAVLIAQNADCAAKTLKQNEAISLLLKERIDADNKWRRDVAQAKKEQAQFQTNIVSILSARPQNPQDWCAFWANQSADYIKKRQSAAGKGP